MFHNNTIFQHKQQQQASAAVWSKETWVDFIYEIIQSGSLQHARGKAWKI